MLTKILLDVINAAEHDVATQAARDARLDALLARVEDQGLLLLQLAEQVTQVSATLATLVARYEAVTAPVRPAVGNGAPAPVPGALPKRLPRPSDVDRGLLLDRYLGERELTITDLGAEYGMKMDRCRDLLLAEAAHRGPTTVSAYRRVAREKKTIGPRRYKAQLVALLGRTVPPGP